ncbi:hypothetical protein BsWGS_28611 [Bradybaena similaris]
MLWQVVVIVFGSLIGAVLCKQHFQEVPKDTNVIRGQTAVLKCVIGDRKGAVQWTKDGFSLGFNRTIPGYDRYSVTSSNENEFSLMIVNAHLEDDAIYECQVLPRGGDDKLQAKASLTVLVPCEPPVILGYSNGSTVEVPFTQQSVELVCEARKGRPAATIDWYRNGVKIMDGVRHGVESIADDKRETARSTITIPLSNSKAENGAVYRCQARNSAVFGLPLMTSVTLSILLPPGPPELSGYDDKVVSINETMVLKCASKGGNPVGTVTWYRNNEPVDWSFTSGGSRAINEYTFQVTSSDNLAVYKCQVTNLVATEPLTAEYKLKVNFPPASVKISGADEPVQAGKTVPLTCVSSHSNPRATITWFAKNRQLPKSEVIETFSTSPEGGYITRSEVRVTVSHQDHNSVFTCQANNAEFGQTVADTLTLSVLYPPSQPEISGYRDSMRAGDLERMTCLSVGGNPLADLKWYKGDKLIREAVYKSIGNVAHSEIAIVVKADDNGATYKCKASNKATATPLETSIKLNINFPPSQVTITISPSQPKVGQQTDLTCVSSSSNPPAEIMWVRNGRSVSGHDLGTTEAEFGGKNTTNRLRISPTSKDHSAVYRCQATNRLLDQSVNDAVTLDVLFKPEFDKETIPDKVDAKNGESTSLNLTTYANPPDVAYSLYKDGVLYSLPPRYTLTNGILNITTVRKEDKGDYMIKAINNQGFATFNFSLNVKYAAEIVNYTNRLALNEGDTAVLFCKADANPLTSDIITWSREDFDMSRTKARTEGDTSYLSIGNLSREDSGIFRCTADNRVGSPDTKSAKLVVRFSPTIDKSPEISRSAGEKGSTVSLICKYQGAPEVTVFWSRNNTPIRPSNKYKMNVEKSGQVKSESSLRIRDLQADDYGTYTCTASNSKGSDSHSITLTGTSKPYTPYNIEFVNATSNSITLTWKPGFDGGLSQSFRVRYKPVDAVGYIHADVQPKGATTFKIKGLELATEYEMTVLAFNDRGESPYQSQVIVAKTSAVPSPADISTSELQGTDEIPVIIILVVCIVGVFILTLNVGLILFFIRRRKKRLEGAHDLTSHTNTFELYGSTNKGDHTLYPPPSDDTRSYGTCDKSMDDFSDEYIRDYDSDYPVSRPYSPHKIDSPKLGGSHKMTYILDDHPGNHASWKEDPYRVANPRHKRGNYENEESNGDIYEIKPRGKDLNELSDLSPSRPSSRAGKTPPPPPTRSSSRGGFGAGDMIPPLPARNYEPQEISSQPRYGPTPGSTSMLSPNIVSNPNYSGPVYGGTSSSTSISHRVISPHAHQPSLHNTVPIGAEHRGHLV